MREIIYKNTSGVYSNRKRFRKIPEVQIETTSWLSKMSTNGGTASNAAIHGVDSAVIALKNYGLWSNILMWYPMVGNQWAAMWTPVVGAQWTDGTTPLNHATAYSEAVGLTGDGAGWINSNLNQNLLSTTNNSICIYARDSLTVGSDMAYFGTSGTLFNSYTEFRKHASNGVQGCLSPTAIFNQYATDQSAALWINTRTASNNIQLYRNKTSVQTKTDATTQPYTWQNINLYVMARNNNGTAGIIGNGIILAGIMVLKQGMTQTDVNNVYGAFKLWNDPVGRTGL